MGKFLNWLKRSEPSTPIVRIDLPVRTAVPAKRMYAAAQTSRLTQDLITSITSQNAEHLSSAVILRSRMRQQERDNSWMGKILSILDNNIIGAEGIKLEMKVRTPRGKLDSDTNAKVEEAWRKNMRRENAGVTRMLNGVELQSLACRAWKRDGAIIFRKRPSYRNDFAFAIEPIEIDRLDHNYNSPQNGIKNEVRFGIEFDGFWSPLAFHILTRHPGEVFSFMQTGPRYRERVPADEIITLWSTLRAGEYLGLPTMTGVIKPLNMLDKYSEAEVIAAYMASCKGGFFEKTNPDAQYKGDGVDSQGNTVTDLSPGQFEELDPNITFKPYDPTHPTDAYPEFVKSQLRQIASGAGVPYNDLANDLEGVNFSSIRSGLIEARFGYMKDQVTIADQFMRPWFESWLPYAILSGQLKVDIMRLQAIKDGACWKGRRWPWVDPMKDVEANVLAIQSGLTSRGRVISENEDGADIEEIFEELAEEKEMAEEAGLEFDTGVKPTPAPDAQGDAPAPTKNGNVKAKGMDRLFLGLGA
jgi:lambda family phage portal protein